MRVALGCSTTARRTVAAAGATWPPAATAPKPLDTGRSSDSPLTDVAKRLSRRQSDMTTPARLAIVGDYDPTMYTHLAIETALGHVREQRAHGLEWSWIATPMLAKDVPARLAHVDAVWLAPGSPYASLEGALAAVR